MIEPAEQEAERIWMLSQKLRRVWEQPDRRTKEWGVFLLMLSTRAGAGSQQVSLLGLEGPLPPPAPFELALLHLVREADRVRVCQNSECAVTRYFFARRRSQKYCSEVCALPAQRELKRRWWAGHGAAWRQRRLQPTRVRRKRGK